MNIDEIMKEDVEELARVSVPEKAELAKRARKRREREHVADEQSVVGSGFGGRKEYEAEEESEVATEAAGSEASKEKPDADGSAAGEMDGWVVAGGDAPAKEPEKAADAKKSEAVKSEAAKSGSEDKASDAAKADGAEDEMAAFHAYLRGTDADSEGAVLESDEYIIEPEEGVETSVAKTRLHWLLDDIRFIVIAFIIIASILMVFPPYFVSGPSMNTTLYDGAFGFGYRFGKPDYGDIVILNTGNRINGTDNDNFIKRVIGLPGDTVTCVYEKCTEDATLADGREVKAGSTVYRVYVNGVLQEEPYAYYGGGQYALTCEYALGEDEYFVMGDNRYNSHDSRAIGPIKKSDIKCVMLFFLWKKPFWR